MADKERTWGEWFTPKAALIGFLYAVVMGGDQLASFYERRIAGAQDIEIIEFTHTPDVRTKFDDLNQRTANEDTDHVELSLKIVNNSSETILLKRMEFEYFATGEMPEGIHETSSLTYSAEYTVYVPDLEPNQKALRYIPLPHVLKPSEADAIRLWLVWPFSTSITGEYRIRPTLVTSVGSQSLKEIVVPVQSNLVPAGRTNTADGPVNLENDAVLDPSVAQ